MTNNKLNLFKDISNAINDITYWIIDIKNHFGIINLIADISNYADDTYKSKAVMNITLVRYVFRCARWVR